MTTSLRIARSLLIASMALPATLHANCSIGTAEMPVQMKGSRAVATVTLNGQPTQLIVDSGAFYSVLSDSVAKELGLFVSRTSAWRVSGVGGDMKMGTGRVDKLGIGTGTFPNVEFLVTAEEFGAGTRGLLGRNVLGVSDIEYDLAHGVIRFHFPNADCVDQNMAYWAGTTPVSEADLVGGSQGGPAIRTYATVNGTKVVTFFDTGATTMVSKRVAGRAGIADADLKRSGTIRGIGRDSDDAWTAMVSSIELGGETIRDSRLGVANVDVDMFVGIEFFLSHRIYVSRLQKKIYFTYEGGPVFYLHRSEAEQSDFDAIEPAPLEPLKTADDYARRGAASASRLEYRSALADLDRACQLAPTSAAYRAARGDIQVALKHRPLALADYDAALELDGSLVEARLVRADLRAKQQDRSGALADLQALDAILTPQSAMRLRMSSAYTSLRRPESVAEIDTWLNAHPRDNARASAFNDRCWARVVLGTDLDKALADCNDAIESDAHEPSFLDSRAWLYFRKGDYKKAMIDFDLAVRYAPDLANSLYGRGLVEAVLGDTARSEADIAAARKESAEIDNHLTQLGLLPDPVLKQ